MVAAWSRNFQVDWKVGKLCYTAMLLDSYMYGVTLTVNRAHVYQFRPLRSRSISSLR